MSDLSSRAGKYLDQEGYRAFVPRDLPPSPSLTMDRALWGALGEAERALGWLSGYAESMDDPGGIAELALRAEAVDSGRLDGLSVSLTDLLRWEFGDSGRNGTGQSVRRIGTCRRGTIEENTIISRDNRSLPHVWTPDR